MVEILNASSRVNIELPTRFSIEVETDLKVCKELWKYLSPNVNIADCWEYRAMWHAIEPQGLPYFIVARNYGQPIGLLPLTYFEQDKTYRWFGGGFWVERSRTFTLPARRLLITPKLYQAVPSGAELLWTEPSEMDQMPAGMLTPQIITYSIQMASLNGNIENIFNRMSGESHKSIRRSIRKVIEKYNPQVIEGNSENINELIALNIKRFGDESTMHIEKLRKILPLMVTTPGVREYTHIVNVIINNQIVASTVILFYKGIYTYYQGGHDPDIPDLGKYHVYALIQDALQRGAKRFDALGEDCGWKDRWRLDQTPLWQHCP